MATKYKLPVDQLQYLAGLTSRKPDDVRESMDDYREEVYTLLNEANGFLEQVEIEELSEQVGSIRDAAEQLKELGLSDEELVAELDTSAGWFGLLADRFNKEGIQAVIDNFDALEQALDSYDDLKEQDSYPGKKDDLESAWGDVTMAISDLVAAHDELGLESDAPSSD